jgi:hypothetical protein
MPPGDIRLVMEATHCDEDSAKRVLEIMREVVFHSTLDWQTREEFQDGARKAYVVLQALEGAPGLKKTRKSRGAP